MASKRSRGLRRGEAFLLDEKASRGELAADEDVLEMPSRTLALNH
jgi:hypothetical protein